jgi:hypothetical protein
VSPAPAAPPSRSSTLALRLSGSQLLRHRRFELLPPTSPGAVFSEVQGRTPGQFTAPADLVELISSIASVGVLQPVLVEDLGERGRRLVAGERRVRAVLWGIANHPENPHFQTIPAVVCPGPLSEGERRTWQAVIWCWQAPGWWRKLTDHRTSGRRWSPLTLCVHALRDIEHLKRIQKMRAPTGSFPKKPAPSQEETDIADCFTAIPHDGLMSTLSERICDREVLARLHAFLRAGVMEDGAVRRPVAGTPQGGVVSPLLCNVYLNRLDRAWRPAYGRPIRYADDLLMVCRTRGEAGVALARITTLLNGLGLWPKPEKTRSCSWWKASRGSTSSASTTGSCAQDHAEAPADTHFLPAGPQRRRCSTPGTASDSSRCGLAWLRRRTGRGGAQPLPARLGRVLPVRELGLDLRRDQEVRRHADRAVRCQTTQAWSLVGVRPGVSVAGTPGPGLPQRNRRRPQANRSWRAPAEHRR